MSNQTFHYTAPDGSHPYGDIAHIYGNVLFGGPGSFEINATGIWSSPPRPMPPPSILAAASTA